MTDAVTLLASARNRLRGSPRERLGEWTGARRILGFGRAPRIVPVGEVWHLGALLIGDDGVFATGEILRARPEIRRGYPAESQRQRAAVAAAARAGGFGDGEIVHLGWRELDLAQLAATGESGILSLEEGMPRIRWSARGAPRPLGDYLADQLDLHR